MQLAAFICIICERQCRSCCWPFICGNLRYLRENNHARGLNQLPKKKPQCLSQISQITQTNLQNHNIISLRENSRSPRART